MIIYNTLQLDKIFINVKERENRLKTWSFLSIFREKLPQYDIDISFMFPINQENCEKNAVQNQTRVE